MVLASTSIVGTDALFHRHGNSGVLYTLMRPELQRVADKASDMGFQFQIIVSYRDPVAQLAAFKAGKSKIRSGGAHNFKPSRAFDFIPQPFAGWNDIQDFRDGAHVFLAAGHLIGVPLIWGGDWNGNGSEADEHGRTDCAISTISSLRIGVSSNALERGSTMFDWVNSTVLNSVLRYLADKAGIAIVAHGFLTGAEWEQVSGIVISLAICVFSIVSAHTKHAALTIVGNGDAKAGLVIVKSANSDS